VAYQRSKEFEQAITSLPESWTPPGEKVEVVQTPIQNKTFEVWRGSLADPGVKQLVSRIQILVSFFIEGGTPIDLDQPDADRWTVFFLYTKHTDPTTKREVYMFAGYCTTYRFYLYLPPTPPASPGQESNGQPAPKDDLDLGDGNFDLSQLPCRSRISQFIIVPPFQKLGVGSAFYSVIFKQYQKHPQTVEITVEDPNEAFDDMRDLSDLAYLRTVSNFLNLRINTSLKLPKAGGPVPKNIVDPEAYETLRRRVKIAPRQFARVLEMHLMSRLPHSVRPEISEIDAETPPPKPKPTRAEQHEYDLWKLLVKARLYRQHRDILGQLEHKERVEKLEETCASVEFEYARLLDKVEAWNKRTGGDLENGGKGKRKADEAPEEEPGSGRKKARFEDA
jgi:histone acetyltransferase 1